MPLKITANKQAIADAINDFPENYRDDYRRVKQARKPYLSPSAPKPEVADALARELHSALRCWGAGKRAAPSLRGEGVLAKALMDRDLHDKLRRLNRVRFDGMGIRDGQRFLGKAKPGSQAIEDFDSLLLDVIDKLAARLLVKCTNVTYPMKSLLLLTGFMPAFDGRVRRGLERARSGGFAATRYLLPTRPESVGAKRITRLPFYLAQCWRESGQVMASATRSSSKRELADDPGRLFDVLLFMQGAKQEGRRLLDFGADQKWFNID